MLDKQAQDEIIDRVTGEVQRREVPLGSCCPEPPDLCYPVPYPFPGNDPTQAKKQVEELQLSDSYEDIPDPNAGNVALSSAGRQRGLEGLSTDELIQAGVGRDEAERISGGTASAVCSELVSSGVQCGPIAGVPVDRKQHSDTYYPPTEGEIYNAAQIGITGALAPLWDQTRDCRSCALCETRKQVVLGSGNTAPTYILVGQAPGPNEDQQGGPFVGPAGEELTAVLNTVEIHRVDECYLMNTVCCRPIDSVTGRVCPPSVKEMAACRPRMADQLRSLLKGGNVKVIVLLGKEAYVDFFYKSEIEAGTFNTNSFRVRPKIGWQDMRQRPVPASFPKVYFTYHPSYILRDGGVSCSDYLAWKQDFIAIKRWGADSLYIKPRGKEILA